MTTPDPHGDKPPGLPPNLTQSALWFCWECKPARHCKNELVFFPDLGVSRVVYCSDHGVVSVAEVVRVRR